MLSRLNIQFFESMHDRLSFLATARSRMIITGLFALASTVILASMVLVVLQPTVVVSSNNLTDQSRIENLRWNWFPAPRSQQVEQIAETVSPDEILANASIRAELLGVVISPWGSYAAISTSARPDGVYAVGDSIENNVTLEAVEQNRVIVSQRGSRRQIPLNSITDNGSSAQRSNESGLMELNESQAGSAQGFSLSGLLSAAPEMVPGVGMGLRLGDVSADLADLADVQEGDVLISVNGTAVGDMISNPVMWQQFSQMTSMPVTILRDEEQIELFVNGASLSEKILPQMAAGRVQ
jgi:type II secretory pathway component PulC